MFDTPEDLLKRIRLGEDSALELKAVRFGNTQVSGPRRGDLADEIAAMANTRGGVLVFGVDDGTRDIEGIPLDRLDTVERYVYEICNESIQPPVLFQSFRITLPDESGELQPVLKIDIPRSLFVHESPSGYFHRQGSSKRKMPPEFLARLMQQRSQARLIRFEEQPVPESGIDDLVEATWRKYTARSSERPDTVLLKRGLLARAEDKAVHASVAGILLCCEHPEQYLPNAFIQAVRYRGGKQDTNYQMDARNIRGPLDRQIDQAMAFFKRNQRVGAVKNPHRIETPQFSTRAVFEALVNAAAHRDYSVFGSKIRFFMFDDRLELYSPGPPPNTVTVDTIAFRQSTRNELISSLLAETPVGESTGDAGRRFYMEKRGDGVPIIMSESTALSGKTPEYQLFDESELLLTIFSASMES